MAITDWFKRGGSAGRGTEDGVSEDGSRSEASTAVETVVTYSEAVVAKGEFGGKTIGYFAGMCLLINNVTGPGMVTMPQVSATGGWLITLFMVFLCFGVSSLASGMMLEAIKMMPGNSKFEQRIEFTTLAKHFFTGKWEWAYYFVLLVFMVTFQTSLITSVIESSQTTDSAILRIFGSSCALQFHNSQPLTNTVDNSTTMGGFGFLCISDDDDTGSSDSVFGKEAYVLSAGFVFVGLLALPLGYWNLDDNIWVQEIACVVLFAIVGEWTVQCFIRGLDFNKDLENGHGGVPVITGHLSDAFGQVLFNFAYVTTLPSWVNEKKVGVPINHCVWTACAIGSVMFILIAILAAAAWDFTGSQDLLAVINSSSTQGSSSLTKVMAILFPFSALVTSIPIFSIMMRYNLLENNICGVTWANIWGCVVPWLLSVVLYTGSALGVVVTWSGLLLIAPLNFALPAYFYIRALRDTEGPTEEKGRLLLNEDPKARVSGSVDPELGTFAVGDLVDAWIPGHKWVPAHVTHVRTVLAGAGEDSPLSGTEDPTKSTGSNGAATTYTVSCVDHDLSGKMRDVSAANVRGHKTDSEGKVLGGATYEIMEENGDDDDHGAPVTVCIFV